MNILDWSLHCIGCCRPLSKRIRWLVGSVVMGISCAGISTAAYGDVSDVYTDVNLVLIGSSNCFVEEGLDPILCSVRHVEYKGAYANDNAVSLAHSPNSDKISISCNSGKPGTFPTDYSSLTASSPLSNLFLPTLSTLMLPATNISNPQKPSMCMYYSTFTSNFIASVFPGDLIFADIAEVDPLPDKPVVVECPRTDTYGQCYDKAKAAFNTASCNNQGLSTCGELTLTAEQSLAASPDTTSNLTEAATVNEPVNLPLNITSAADAIDVFDFTISDGAGDSYPTVVTQVVINAKGEGDLNLFSWRLNGDGVDQVMGTTTNDSEKITFSDLNISVAEGNSSEYTLSVFITDAADVNNGEASVTTTNHFQFIVDGDTDLTLDPTMSQMRNTSPVMTAVASTKLVIAEQTTNTGGGGSSVSPVDWLVGLLLLLALRCRRSQATV